MTPDVARQLRSILRERTGGYLRNVERTAYVTCQICTAPVEGSLLCNRCSEHRSSFGNALADLVVPVVYGGQTAQSQTLFYGYKDPSAAQPGDERRSVMHLMFGTVGLLHRRCIEAVVGAAITAVVTVPSTRQRADHPLPALAAGCLPRTPRLLALPAALQPADPRTVVPDRFVLTPVSAPADQHVLVLDDTWATGARTQSMAVALRQLGAAHVSILVLARWLAPSWPPTARYLESHQHRDFDPSECPVTGSRCPAPAGGPGTSAASDR